MFTIDAAQRNLIIVSTFNRKDLTTICLDSLARNKSPRSQVVILDDTSTEYDAEWLGQWGWPVHRRETRLGVGLAARARFEHAASAPGGYGFFIALDNDLVFARDFDARMRALYEPVRAIQTNPVFVSGYRSVTYNLLRSDGDYNWAHQVGGACLGFDRTAAAAALSWSDWSSLWDQNTIGKTCLVPTRSLCQHLGTSGTGQNGLSWDTAYDFVGEGRW